MGIHMILVFFCALCVFIPQKQLLMNTMHYLMQLGPDTIKFNARLILELKDEILLYIMMKMMTDFIMQRNV